MNPAMIHAGVLSGHKCSELLDHIQQNGQDIHYERIQQETKDTVNTWLGDFDLTEGKDALLMAMTNMVKSLHLETEASELFSEFVDPQTLTFDLAEIQDFVLQKLGDMDCLNVEEPEHLYHNPETQVQYKTFWLQSLNVRVVESCHYTLCRMCSPCCPNQGDLDSEYHELDSVYAYCPPPDEWDHGNRPIWKVSDDTLVSGQP